MGFEPELNPGNRLGDKAYAGNGMIKKSAHRGFLGWEKEFSLQLNRIQYVIERTIANLEFVCFGVDGSDQSRPEFPDLVAGQRNQLIEAAQDRWRAANASE